MSFMSWFRSQRSQNGLRSKSTGRSLKDLFRPRLEALEGRALPSTYYAGTAADLIADINAANKAGGGNTILLYAPSTSPYIFTAANNTKYGYTVLPVIAKGDNLIIQTSNGEYFGRDTLDAGQHGRLFVVAPGAALHLEDVVLQNGYVSGVGVAKGGAVYNLGDLYVDNTVIQSNEAFGGYGWPTKGKNAVTGIDAAGGGIWSNGMLTIQNQTVIQNNTVVGVGTGSGYGGGVYIAGGATSISDSTIGSEGGAFGTYADGNWALGGYDLYSNTFASFGPGGGYGGGIYVAAGTATLTNDVIQYNLAGYYINGGFDGFNNLGYGGGIYIGPAASVYMDSLTVSETIFNIDYYNLGSPTANVDGSYILLP